MLHETADGDWHCGGCGKRVDLDTPEGRSLLRGGDVDGLPPEGVSLSDHDASQPEYWLDVYPVLTASIAHHEGGNADERDLAAILLSEIVDENESFGIESDDCDILRDYLRKHVATGAPGE